MAVPQSLGYVEHGAGRSIVPGSCPVHSMLDPVPDGSLVEGDGSNGEVADGPLAAEYFG